MIPEGDPDPLLRLPGDQLCRDHQEANPDLEVSFSKAVSLDIY